MDDRRMAPNRNIFLYSEINKESVKEVMERIVYINEFDQDQLDAFGEKYQPEAIKIRICSGGGHISPTIGLMEEIIHSATPIITVCDGEVCSSAFLIFICGQRRYLKIGSTVMMHPSTSGFFGQLKSIQSDVVEYSRLESYVQNMILDLTKIPKKVIDAYYASGTDRYFTETECVDWKICDDIYGREEKEEEVVPEEKPKKKAPKKKIKKGKKNGKK